MWVDFKLYDIPNTVKLRTENISADIISVHASGGVKMMREAVASGKEIYAITILTSFSEAEEKQIYNQEVSGAVLNLARLAREAGVAGVVCSPKEVKFLRSYPEFANLKIVVPGVRSFGIDSKDQIRVGTPREAILDGADYLVIGRQITEANDPILALSDLQKELI